MTGYGGGPDTSLTPFAIFAGIFGLATSLGLGVQQVTSGLDYLFGIPANNLTMVLLIVGITAIALISVMTGINVGIKRLSQFNIILAFLLLAAIIFLGPTGYIFKSLFAGLGAYVMKIVPLSNWIGREDTAFLHDWTTFYWAWWIAWAPLHWDLHCSHFKGTHGSRICNLCPAAADTAMFDLVQCLWGHCYPTSSSPTDYTGVTEKVETYTYPIALFEMFAGLPWTMLLSCVAMTLTIIFFVTSSDSGSLIIDHHRSRWQG